MNCECVYTIKNGTESEYDKLAEKVKHLNLELYPITYAVVTHDVTATTDYDGRERAFTLKQGTPIIFVSGKYCYMQDIGNAKALFPQQHDCTWFKDLKEY